MINCKKLSIIMPIYNMEKYLPMCFKSLEHQAWEKNDIEIICVDDGSSDKSLFICEQYAKNNSYVRVFSKENGGVSSARNYGLSKAVGEYICWLDPDDCVSDDFYCQIRNFLEKNYDLLFFDFTIAYPNGMKRLHYYAKESGEISAEKYIIDSCNGMKNLRPLWTKITKRILWKDIVFPDDISYSEDYFVWTKILPKLRRIYYLREELYLYRMHSRSICHNITVEDVKKAFILVQDRCIFLSSLGYKVSNIGVSVEACMLLQELVNLSSRTEYSNTAVS